jgi:competence protein ComEA
MMRSRLVAAAVTAAVVMGAGVVRPVEAGQAGQDGKPAASAPAPLNLNVATVADLQKLPGIGPALAARILDYRQKNGGFKKIEELMNVQGIGEQSFLKLKPLVVIAPAKTAER